MKRFILLVIILAGFAVAKPDAVGTLYTRDLSGSLLMTCTATIVDGPQVGVVGIAIMTAAHCVERSLVLDEGEDAWRTTADYLVTFDEMEYYPVRLHRVGYPRRGYDLATLIFHARTPDIEPLLIGDWANVRVGTAIVNHANPLGIGVQSFTGYVSMLRLERPVSSGNVNWRDHAVAILPGAGGSSGSLVLNVDAQVIGVLVGVIQGQFGSPFVIFVPQDRFGAFFVNDAAGRTIAY